VWLSSIKQRFPAASPVTLPTGFDELINMVSISTLFAFWIVALALIWHRCFQQSHGSIKYTALLGLELLVLVAAAIGESAVCMTVC
jgi:hypothetical protein